MSQLLPRPRTLHSADPGPMLLVVLLCLGFFALWTWNLGYPSLSGDESFVAILTAEPAGEILQRLNTDEPHPPVYYLLMRLWQQLAGSRPEFLVRYPSLLVGLLLLSLLYRLGRDLGLGWPAALAASLWLGLNPQLTVHMREARMYGPMVASLALVVLVSWRFERLPRRWAIILAASSGLLALLTHYFDVLFVAPVGLWGLLTFRGEFRKRWLVSQTVVWGCLALWLVFLGRGFFNPTSLSQGKTWSFILPPWDTLARLLRIGLQGYRDLYPPGLTLTGVGLLIGGWLAGSLKGSARHRWLLLLGVAGPLLAYALLGWFKPIFHAKYTLPWLLFVALALGRLLARRPWLGAGVMLGLLALMAWPTWRTLRMPYDPGFVMSRDEWLRPVARELGDFLVTHAGPTDTFGTGTPDAAHCYYAEHYFERSVGCALIPARPTQSLDELEVQVRELLARHRVLWLLDYYNPYWDPHHLAEAALAHNALSLGVEQATERQLRLYTSQQTVLQQMQPVGARFGEVAELAGIWLVPGQDLHLVLVWRSLADHPPIVAKTFIHLLDSSGQIVAQQDGLPVWWTRPLATWQPGEILLDAYTLTTGDDTAGQDWSLRVGFYDPDTLTRLPARASNGAPLPDDAVAVSLDRWLPAAEETGH
ncbi:MAG: glycosyltransferase family 39 protein [Chloroflexota bacterium]